MAPKVKKPARSMGDTVVITTSTSIYSRMNLGTWWNSFGMK